MQVGTVADSVQAMKELGPLYGILIVVVIFWHWMIYYRIWPSYQEQVKEDKKFHRELVQGALARVDAANEKIPAALDRLGQKITEALDRLFAQNEKNTAKLDAILDGMPTMEDAERRWRQAVDRKQT